MQQMTRSQRRLTALIAAACAASGGVIAIVMVVTARSLSWLIFGLAVSFGLAAAASRTGPARGALGMLLGYTFAFVLLLWPVAILVALLLTGPVPAD
jgi:EamA domain-containing membrane protein RarD